MRSKSSSRSSTSASRAMASRCRTALVDPPTRHHDGDRVLERLAGDDAGARVMPSLEQPDHGLAGAARELVAARVGARCGRRLPAAPGRSPRPRTAIVLAVNMPAHEPSDGQAARSMASSSASSICAAAAGADRLEDVLDRDVATVVVAGQDRAAVEEHGWRRRAGPPPSPCRAATCRSRRRSPCRRSRSACITVSTESAMTSRLDQRRAHALVAHRDAVGDRDRVNSIGIAAGVADAELGLLGQPVERQVAGRDLVPRRRRRRPAACPSPRRSCRWPAASPGRARARSRR